MATKMGPGPKVIAVLKQSILQKIKAVCVNVVSQRLTQPFILQYTIISIEFYGDVFSTDSGNSCKMFIFMEPVVYLGSSQYSIRIKWKIDNIVKV